MTVWKVFSAVLSSSHLLRCSQFGAVVIGATELLSASLGYWVYRSQQPLYPVSWYPDQSLPLLVTQTIQISCYLSRALFSGVLFLYMAHVRCRTVQKMLCE